MEGMIFRVDVGLIYFIGNKDEVLLFAELDDVFYDGFLETAAGWVTRINDYHSAGTDSLRSSFLERGKEIGDD
jgi:hypothetical protein